MSTIFKHPSNIIVAGPSQCGKTQFVKRVLTENMIQPPPSRIIYFYAEKQPAFEELRTLFPIIEFVQGFKQDIYENLLPTDNNLVIIDDLMSEVKDSADLSNLFTRGSHHKNATIILIVQNVYAQGKSMRNVNINSHYSVLFKNPRDTGQITTLAIQMDKRKRKFIEDAFQDATSTPYGYLLCDFCQTTPEENRFRTKIFKDQDVEIYVPKGIKVPEMFA